jgi:hypothetical protein
MVAPWLALMMAASDESSMMMGACSKEMYEVDRRNVVLFALKAKQEYY